MSKQFVPPAIKQKKLIKFESVKLPPNNLIVRIPDKVSSIVTLTITIDEERQLEVVKMGKSVQDFLDVNLGDAVIVEGGKRAILKLNRNGENQDFLLITVDEIFFVVENPDLGEVVGLDVTDKKFADPNVVSPALHHVDGVS